jgi:hypothetical protein
MGFTLLMSFGVEGELSSGGAVVRRDGSDGFQFPVNYQVVVLLAHDTGWDEQSTPPGCLNLVLMDVGRVLPIGTVYREFGGAASVDSAKVAYG